MQGQNSSNFDITKHIEKIKSCTEILYKELSEYDINKTTLFNKISNLVQSCATGNFYNNYESLSTNSEGGGFKTTPKTRDEIPETDEYVESADYISLAFGYYQNGKIESALEMATLAFDCSDAQQLFSALATFNDETDKEKTEIDSSYNTRKDRDGENLDKNDENDIDLDDEDVDEYDEDMDYIDVDKYESDEKYNFDEPYDTNEENDDIDKPRIERYEGGDYNPKAPGSKDFSGKSIAEPNIKTLSGKGRENKVESFGLETLFGMGVLSNKSILIAVFIYLTYRVFEIVLNRGKIEVEMKFRDEIYDCAEEIEKERRRYKRKVEKAKNEREREKLINEFNNMVEEKSFELIKEIDKKHDMGIFKNTTKNDIRRTINEHIFKFAKEKRKKLEKHAKKINKEDKEFANTSSSIGDSDDDMNYEDEDDDEDMDLDDDDDEDMDLDDDDDEDMDLDDDDEDMDLDDDDEDDKDIIESSFKAKNLVSLSGKTSDREKSRNLE